MFKKIYILFKIARKLSKSEALKVIAKIHQPPKIIIFLSNLLSFSLSNSSRKDNLTRHIKSVHLHIKENMCHLCDRQFSSKVELKAHLLVQDCNKKVFNCKICDAIFSRKSSLKSHIATFHNEIKGTKYEEPETKRRYISKSIKEEL